MTDAARAYSLRVAKPSRLDATLAEVRALGAAPTAEALRPHLSHKAGVVVAAAAKIAAKHELRALAPDLETAFARLFDDATKTDPGCFGKLAAAEALRALDVNAPALFLRGVAYQQREGYGGADSAGALRVCCAGGLLQTRHPYALAEIAPLLADPVANVRAGVATMLGPIGLEATDALLRLKVKTGDAEPEVIGACLKGLLESSVARNRAFVLDAIEGAESAVVQLALLALGETHDESVVAPLRTYADTTSDDDVRSAALLGLSLARLASANDYLVGLIEDASEKRGIEALRALAPQRYDAALVARARAAAEARGPRVAAVADEVLGD